jgi:hypothetical protein
MKKIMMTMVCIMVAGLVQAVSMSSSIQAEIKKRAETKWPDDFSMQAYHIKSETEAFESFQAMEKPSSMSSSTFELIKSRAERMHPKDYSGQFYELKKQVKGWLQVNGK